MTKSLISKCTECPECECVEYARKNELGEGFRVCVECRQEWWVDINYKKYKSPAYFYEVFTNVGRSLPTKDKNGDANQFDKRSVKRRIRKLLKSGRTVTAFVTKPDKKRDLIYCNWEPTGFVNSLGV